MTDLDEIMGQTYVPRQFWKDAGDAYWRPGIEKSPEHAEQEAVLRPILERLDFATVLDVGCGGGRLGRLIMDVEPEAKYTGVDISEQALMVARGYLPNAELIQSTIEDYQPARRRWDLVLTSEVLMHVPPENIDRVIGKLQRAARQLLCVEWVVRGAPPEKIAGWNWPHDYSALGVPIAYTGQQAVYLWTP